MKICISCGQEYADSAPRCVRCGESMTGDAVNDAVTGMRVKPSPTARSGLLCGRYEIVEELGRGGMGLVYRARDRERRDADVALKVLVPELAADPRAVDELSKEADLAMSLAHPNVISLHNLERDGASGTRFLVMEFIRGESLAKLLERRGPLPADEAVSIVRQALAGLNYAHRKGIIHRDIKPSNLMRAEDGTVKLGDFGIARRAKDALAVITGRGATGTLLYMSPEQVRGEPVDARTDLYSMGCVLYELLSGHPPFKSGSIEWQIQNQPATRIASAPLHVWEAVNRAMSKDRAERFASCAAFGEALERPPAELARPQASVPVPPPPMPAAFVPTGPLVPPAAAAPPDPVRGARIGHYVLVNLARAVLIAVMVFFWAAKTHRAIMTDDEYGIAWFAGGGLAVLLFIVASIVSWRAKKRTGTSIGGTWHPAARWLILLPALGCLLAAYAKGKGAEGSDEQRLTSACVFMGLELLLFTSFFAVRLWRTLGCCALIAASLLGLAVKDEVDRKGGLEKLFQTRKNPGLKPAPPPTPPPGTITPTRVPDPFTPPSTKIGPYTPEVHLTFITVNVVGVGMGAQGGDLLDLAISTNDRNRRIASVLYQFPESFRPSSQRATDAGNGFAVRIQAFTPFQVTARVTMIDGAVRDLTQVIRWR